MPPRLLILPGTIGQDFSCAPYLELISYSELYISLMSNTDILYNFKYMIKVLVLLPKQNVAIFMIFSYSNYG